MKRKVLINDYASFIESKYLPNTEGTYRFDEANVVINPINDSIFNKDIIINLPIELPIAKLIENNTVVSRFPINDIPCIPYDSPVERKDVTDEDMSCIILQDFMLLDEDYIDLVKSNKFLIGIDESIDQTATVIGMTILGNKVEDLGFER